MSTGEEGRARRRWPRRLGRLALGLVLALALLRGTEFVWNRLDPFDAELLEFRDASRRVLDREGRVLRVTSTPRGERMLPVRFEELPALLVRGLTLKEDERYWEHGGVDPWAILRASMQNVRAGRIVSGASTLTMQLAGVLDATDRSLFDKVHEMRRARQIERAFDKERILAAYATVVPMGGALRGFGAASLYWYGRELDGLRPCEIATLIAMLPAPTRRRPSDGGGELRSARDQVLRLLRQAGELTEAEFRRALATDPRTEPVGFSFLAPHAVDAKLARAGSHSRGALRTSLDLALQERVESCVRSLDDFGVDGHAVVVLSRRSGELLALLGSRSWREIPWNAAFAPHDAGSTLKPFLYRLAFAMGASTPGRIERDLPIERGDYRPRNFDVSFQGQVHASDALRTSRNVPAFRLLRRIGVGAFRRELVRVGIPTPEEPLHLDLALGTLGVRPIDLARAYQKLAAAADSGEHAAQGVLTALGEDPPPGCAGQLRGAVAWKTGTSSARRDAWCAGATRDYVLVVWLGRMDGRPAPSLIGIDSAAVLFGELCLSLDQ